MKTAVLIDLIEDHLDRYPDLEAVDLYVLLHQVALGPGQEIVAPKLALEALVEQARSLDLEVREWEEPVEVLDHDRELARVHLRPYLRAGGEVGRLHAAVVSTASQLHGNHGYLRELASMALQHLDDDVLADASFARRDLQRVIGEASRGGFQEIPTHSEIYRELYEPAYHVVLLDELAS